eukprot:241976_1
MDALKVENEKLRKQIEQLQKHANATSVKSPIETEVINRHGSEFWHQVEVNCLKDPDAVKALVKTKQITVNDLTPNKETLLHVAVMCGSYDMVQFCINTGFDMNHRDEWDNTPLENAKRRGHYHIEQLLSFNAMKVNVGKEVTDLAANINRQNGINQIISNELQLLDEQKDLFEQILMKIMTNIIRKKLSFSDQLLSHCWLIACKDGDVLSSDLWKAISSTCSEVISNEDRRDWFWFKTCILESTIWYKEVKIEEEKTDEEFEAATTTHYLYYELLKLVKNESKNQITKLEHDLDDLANQNRVEWNTLLKWNLDDADSCANRQDLIPNGITSRYTYKHLLEKSGSAFNSTKFYDFNEYLSQLVLLAQIVDDQFQQSVQQMFSINKMGHEGILSSNSVDTEEKTNYGNDGDGLIRYVRGPVKSLERARNKAENDYLNEAYPQSACVLDLNRCTLMFNDIPTMLRALKLFVNKIKYYQSDSIIRIVRAKNGFIDYVQSTQYADIKLNVLIRGKQNNIIGEVQFLLRRMKEYKDIAHNLYSIERTQEAIERTQEILPLLLDEEKQLFRAASMGSVKEICKIMVINNRSKHEIMTSNAENRHILHNIIRFEHSKLFFYLKSILSTEEFVAYVLSPDTSDITALENGLRNSSSIVKALLHMKQIRSVYDDNHKPNVWRLIYWIFVHNSDMEFARYVLSVLDISNETVSKMILYKYPQNHGQLAAEKTSKDGYKYHRYTIFGSIAQYGTREAIETLVDIVGHQILKIYLDQVDDYNQRMIEYGCMFANDAVVKYIIEYTDDAKERYAKNKDLLFRLLCCVFYMDEDMVDYVLSELQIDKSMIQEIATHRCHAPLQEFGCDAVEWHEWTLITYITFHHQIKEMKQLRGLMDEKAFCDGVMLLDGYGDNSVNVALECEKWDIVSLFLDHKPIRERCMTNMED